MMKKLLITGATGFLGSYLTKQLLGSYHILATRRPSSNLSRLAEVAEQITWVGIDTISLEKVFQENSIYAVIHCATQYGRKEVENLETIEANLMLPLRILEFCQKYNSPIFINTDTILDKRMSYYSFSKSQFKDWMQFCSSRLICINMELEHFYGPCDDDSKFVTWLIHSLLKKVPQLDLTLGEQTRSFMYVSDVVAAFTTLLEKAKNFKNGFYNFQVGSANEIKIKDFILLIKDLTKNEHTVLNFGALPYRANETMSVHLQTKPLQDLGWSEKVLLRDGLIQTITLEKNKIKGASK